MGKKGTLKHEFPFGAEDHFRLIRGEVLRLKVQFVDGPVPDHTQVILSTNMGDTGDGSWQEIPFDQMERGVFELKAPLEAAGSFRGKIRYSFDGGRKWYRDRLPLFSFIVDPSGVSDVRLYTLIPNVSGTIADWKEKLIDIKEMGFNTVHLLPITAMDESESPYAARYLFRIDNSYKCPDSTLDIRGQFEDFVEEAKTLDLRLCFDMVLNHVGITSELAQKCPHWIVFDEHEEDGFRRAGAHYGHDWVKWMDLARLNYDTPVYKDRRELWDYMTEYLLYWANYANYTGGMVRLDNLHSSCEAFVEQALIRLRREYPDLIVFAELFTEHSNMVRLMKKYGINLLLATPWGAKFAPYLRQHVTYIHEHWYSINYFFPITTHDTGAPAEEFGSAASTIPRYLICMLYGTGSSGLVQGVEFGYPQKVEFIGRFGRIQGEHRHDFRVLIGLINRLAARFPMFSTGGNMRFVDQQHKSILGAMRLGGAQDGCDFLMLANLDIHQVQSIKIATDECFGAHTTHEMFDYLTEQTLPCSDSTLNFDLEPCGIKIYRINHRG